MVLAMETATHCAVYGQFLEARSILEKSLESNPDNRDAFLNLSRFCDTHNNNDEGLKESAVEYAETALERFPSDHVVIEYFARMLVEREDLEQAGEILEDALGRDVKDGDYWLSMGSIARAVWPLRNERNRERVNEVYEKALRADPKNLDMVERVAQFFRSSGSTDRALQIYEKLVRRSPDRLSARKDLAELYWQADMQQKAIAGLEALVQINPEAIELRRTLSEMYLAAKDLESAIGHSEAIVESGRAEIDDFQRLADFQRVSDRTGGALQTLRHGVTIYPESPQLSYSLGILFLQLDRYDDAYAALESSEAKAEAGDDEGFLTEGFYFDYAVTAERSGAIDRAEELFRKSMDLVGDSARENRAKSLNYLGYMWLELEKNIGEAGEMIKEANELKPDNGAYLDSLGWFYFLKKDYDEALKHLLRAEELMAEEPQKDSVIFEHIARAYLGKEDIEKARSYCERALELEPEKAELKELKQLIEEGA